VPVRQIRQQALLQRIARRLRCCRGDDQIFAVVPTDMPFHGHPSTNGALRWEILNHPKSPVSTLLVPFHHPLSVEASCPKCHNKRNLLHYRLHATPAHPKQAFQLWKANSFLDPRPYACEGLTVSGIGGALAGGEAEVHLWPCVGDQKPQPK
jgi:hypothetical protein